MTRPLCALVLLLAVPAQAQFVDGLDPAPLDAEGEAPPAEGIQVHGRWTLTVREPNGAVVEERVFQNALTTTDAAALTGVLIGAFSDPSPFRVNRVRLGASSEADMPCTSSGSGVPCYVVQPGHPTEGGPNVSATLQVGPIGSGLSLDALRGFVLIGSIQAARDARIDQVATVYNEFDGGLFGGGTEEFTLKVLDAPLPVADGQTVDVRVEVTFE